MFRRLAIGVLALIALAAVGVLVMAALQPDELRVERHTTIAAPAAAVFPLIDDLQRFTEWSPWQKLDPAMTTAFSGPRSGVDASYSWKGNRSVGAGRLTITESRPDSLVGMRLEFLEPFASTSRVEFRLEPAAGGTRVTWAMSGENDFASKLGSVFFDMEQMIGRDFESGLAGLKALAEAAGPGWPQQPRPRGAG